MITPVWIIGFTGHRPKDTFGRTAAELTRLAPTVRAELQRLKAKAEAQHGRADFLCGMAAGADIIAAREAEALGMIVHVILPMPESEFAKDFAEPGMEDDWKEAQRFIALARAGTWLAFARRLLLQPRRADRVCLRCDHRALGW